MQTRAQSRYCNYVPDLINWGCFFGLLVMMSYQKPVISSVCWMSGFVNYDSHWRPNQQHPAKPWRNQLVRSSHIHCHHLARRSSVVVVLVSLPACIPPYIVIDSPTPDVQYYYSITRTQTIIKLACLIPVLLTRAFVSPCPPWHQNR